jgi:hypothetical protein
LYVTKPRNAVSGKSFFKASTGAVVAASMLDAPIRGKLLVPMILRQRLRRSFKRIAAFLRPNTGGPLNAFLRARDAQVPRSAPWGGAAERQLLLAVTPNAGKLASSDAIRSRNEASARTTQGYPTANIIVEPESPGNPRSLFRVYAFGRIYEEGLTAAQAQVLVGDFLETLILPANGYIGLSKNLFELTG